MIAAAVAMVAIASQAAVTFNWKTTKSVLDGNGASSLPAGDLPVYLFASGTTGEGTTLSRAALLAALEDKTYASVAEAWAAVGYGPEGKKTNTNDGKVPEGSTSSDVTHGAAAGDTMSFYFVAQNAKGDLFFSADKTGVIVQANSVTTASFASDSLVTTPSMSYTTIEAIKAGGAGWVAMSSPGPIPEPTSGLLLLLGVAGLALRRKHV